mmetsp:Transcript_23923/g.42387  ORF Transcript_23923/g.42387 Transcript_23923/m.42387 type:complete len:137 (-) Transcript_23923:201-611(-)
MGRLFKTYLSGNVLYTCSQCSTHLALHNQLISTSFHGRTGRAYLFSKVANVALGPLEERIFTTGLHSVCDIYCICCHSNVGWYYKEVPPCCIKVRQQHSYFMFLQAYEESQKYKEGKFIVEKALMRKSTMEISEDS